jgi:hypothetical protein
MMLLTTFDWLAAGLIALAVGALIYFVISGCLVIAGKERVSSPNVEPESKYRIDKHTQGEDVTYHFMIWDAVSGWTDNTRRLCIPPRLRTLEYMTPILLRAREDEAKNKLPIVCETLDL